MVVFVVVCLEVRVLRLAVEGLLGRVVMVGECFYK